jgi:energy-coupling factor transport system ATP-binding protein
LWALQGALTCSGAIDVRGNDPRRLGAAEARRLVTLVPQTAADLLYLPSVGAECAQADAESDAEPGTTAALLRTLGVDVPDDRDPRDLSEGQRLALVLAVQLAAKPPVLLLDEPTRGLDYRAKGELRGIVQQLAAQGVAVLISTHDVEFAAATSTRTLLMADGQVIADGPTADVLTSSPAFAPQVAKVFAPAPVLTADDVARTITTQGPA